MQKMYTCYTKTPAKHGSANTKKAKMNSTDQAFTDWTQPCSTTSQMNQPSTRQHCLSSFTRSHFISLPLSQQDPKTDSNGKFLEDRKLFHCYRVMGSFGVPTLTTVL